MNLVVTDFYIHKYLVKAKIITVLHIAMLYFVHCLVFKSSEALTAFFAVFLFNFDSVFLQLNFPCGHMFTVFTCTVCRPIITLNSSEALKVSKTTKCVSLNLVETYIRGCTRQQKFVHLM